MIPLQDWIERWITPRNLGKDPDDDRRRRTLNIILLSLMLVTGAVMVLVVIVLLSGLSERFGIRADLLVLSGSAFAGFALLYQTGRYLSGKLASSVLLILLIALLFSSDSLHELIDGRSTLYFILPIMMASMLLRPVASFVVMGVIVIAHAALAISMLGSIPNFLASTVFFMAALISWLSAHTLEQAINDLRLTNQELDQRVADRTQALSQALAREQSEASKNQTILESLGEGVLVFDLQNRLILTNAALNAWTGLSIEQMNGQSFEDFLGGLEVAPEQIGKALKAYENPSEAANLQIEWKAKTFSVTISPMLQKIAGQPGAEAVQPIGMVVTLHDITYEMEISRMKSSFVSMVSHELRTPLSALLGLLEMMEYKLYGPLTEKQEGLVMRMLNNVRNLIGMVEDLLDRAKIEAGTLSLQPLPFAAQDLLAAVTEVLRPQAEKKGLEMQTQIEAGFPERIMGDVQRLNQVLTNLATNAVKYTESGQVAIRFFQPGAGQWAMEVQDSGIGIDPEAGERIFEPFWQADSSIGRRAGGVGLGLSIVKRLVGLMNGEIRLQSQKNAGSTFTVVLPLLLPEE